MAGGLLAPVMNAAEVVFDFETEFDALAWPSGPGNFGRQDGSKMGIDDKVTANGKRSLRFFMPAWKLAEHRNTFHWPSFEGRFEAKDFSQYDRLAVYVFNNSDADQLFGVMLKAGKESVSGQHVEYLAPGLSKAVVMPLGEKNELMKRVTAIHFFSENPPAPLDWHIDSLTLLKPGEAVPPISRQLLETSKRFNKRCSDQISTYSGKLKALDFSCIPENQRGYFTQRFERLKEQATLFSNAAGDWDIKAQVEMQHNYDIDSLSTLTRSFAAMNTIRSQIESATGYSDVFVGWAPAMTKILPYAPNALPAGTPVELALARNEHEAFQVVILPTAQDLKEVAVSVSDLQGPNGAIFSNINMDVIPVGYFQTDNNPASRTEYIGWWPDPLLTYLKKVGVKQGAAQSFWIRLNASKTQAPGEYQGVVTVQIAGEDAFRMRLQARVFSFDVPDAQPLPLALTFHPEHSGNNDAALRNNWKDPEFPLVQWSKHKKEWARMLADYYITYDSLYDYNSSWRVDFDMIKDQRDKGQLGMFNLGGFWAGVENPAGDYGMDGVVARLRPAYEKAKEMGVLDHAYIYAGDEFREARFEKLEHCFARLKKEFPDVPLFSSAREHSFGQVDKRLKSVDWFCPQTCDYDLENADKARANGRKVWWYVCVQPYKPFANLLIEYPAIDARLLMGAMAAKFRPDGFMYYQMSIWNGAKGITDGPFTSWSPRSWGDYNGDGALFYPGPDSTPLATLRMENFRDGLEDYAYHKMLGERVKAIKAAGAKSDAARLWLADAEAALVVPDKLVKSMYEYSYNPDDVFAYRQRLASLIEAGNSL